MNKIDKLAGELFGQARLEFSEALALVAAMETAWRVISDTTNTAQREYFEQRYGKITYNALEELMRGQP